MKNPTVKSGYRIVRTCWNRISSTYFIERSQENSINLRVPELHKKDMFGVKGDGGGLYRRR
jgi:hypothetical protein